MSETTIKTYQLKLDKSHLSKAKKEYLNRLFLEKKWFRNYAIAQDDVFAVSYKLKEVDIKVKDTFEKREINYLSSQMRQAVLGEIGDNIKALSRIKKKGAKVGRLKFVSECNSLDLSNQSFALQEKYLKLQGFKPKFKINGTKQIPTDAKFCGSKLIKKPSGYYFYLTVKIPYIESIQCNNLGIGFDFGVKDNIIDNFGNKYNWKFEETQRIKQSSKNLNRNWQKTQEVSKHSKHALGLEYEKINNKKKDIRNKFVAKIKPYAIISVQDENLAAWKSNRMKGWGKKFQYSIMGGIMSDIKNLPQTVVIDRFFPSTKLCPICGQLNTLTLTDRIYHCDCGYSEDRDIKSAKTILQKGIQQVVGRNLYLEEEFVNTYLKSNFNKQTNLLTSEAKLF